MNTKVIYLINIVLAVIAGLLVWKIYRLIMEPIEFEKIKKNRYEVVQESLINIREAQLAYREEMGHFCGDLNELVAFVDTGSVTIVERKDTSFMYYNRIYQQEMMKDSLIIRVLGSENVKKNRFGADFEVETILYIPFSEDVPFDLGAGVIDRNGVKVDVFEASAADKYIFTGLKNRFNQYIEPENRLQVGSLTEPTISGNWQ